MKVSVDADRQAAPAVLGESRQARHEIGFSRENGIGERLALGTECLPCALEVAHAAFDLFPRVLRPAGDDLVIGDFRRESRVVGVGGEGDMHFAQSPADHRHELVEESEGVW